MINKEQSITCISFIYIFVEATALLFLIDIFTIKLDLDTLSLYEKFGYFSASIGISLLILFQVKKHVLHSIPYWILFILTLPILYVTSAWLLHSTIHKIPDIVPDSKKSMALTASVRLLNSPSIGRGLGFYLPNESQLSTSEIKNYVSNYPMSNKVIQRFYTKGIINARDYSINYDAVASKVDKQKWSQQIKKLEAKRFFLLEQSNTYVIGSVAHMDMSLVTIYALSPFTLQKAFDIVAYSPIKGDVGKILHVDAYNRISKKPFESILSSKLNFQMANEYDNSTMMVTMQNKYIWQKLAKQYDFISSTNQPDNNNILEGLRESYSEHMLYNYSPGTKFNWYDGNPYDDQAYKKGLLSIVPFLFNENEQPIITLSKLQDKEFIKQSVNNLSNRLPLSLKTNWQNYREASIIRLSGTSEHWENRKLESATHNDMVRVSVVLPIMVIVSALLLLINLFRVSRGSKTNIAIGLGVLLLAFISSQTPIKGIMLDVANDLSLYESQVFLH